MGSLGNAGYIYHLYGRDALIGGVSDDTELAQFDHWSYDDPEVTLTVKDPVKPYQADFFLPNHDVTVSAVFAKARTAPAFGDIPAGAYYADAIAWAAEQGITGGTDENHFSPDASCTRAQIVTFLWQAAGRPVVNYILPFEEVAESS